MPPKSRTEFEIAIICALPLEADAVEALFDETYDNFGRIYGKESGDANTYTNGKIGEHHVVLCHMPGMGKGSAASIASSLLISYERVQLALVVGVCGGVPFPSDAMEIVLGDVLISDSVVEYDFGKQYPDGFQRKTNVKDTLGRPNREIRSFLNGLKTRKTRKKFQERISEHLKTLHTEQEWQYPGIIYDVLFEASYRHKHYQTETNTKCICLSCYSDDDAVCDEARRKDCNVLGCAGKPVYRRRPNVENVGPSIHIGTIASADTVMKSGKHRDLLAAKEEVIGFEMEGGGVWDNLPCIVIKGVCDYADSHKNNIWQNYAAATGACGAKAFLEYWKPHKLIAITDDDKRCLHDLLLSNPDDDRRRIEETKGGLLSGSCSWVLHSPEFQQWRNHEESQILWIKGDAGKGKTMLIISIIKELLHQVSASVSLSFFLCQATDSRLNSATAVLRGMIYFLVQQQPLLISYLRKSYDSMGRKMFEDGNAFYSLSSVFQEMLQDSKFETIYLILDALDECEYGLTQLIHLITETTSTASSRIKWIVSSRNQGSIEQHLGLSNSHITLSLESNAEHICNSIDRYIDYHVSQLVSLKYNKPLQTQVKERLHQKSDGTFLWVSIVTNELQGDVLGADMLEILEEFPSGLVPLYDRMIRQIQKYRLKNQERCCLVLSAAALAYRPLHWLELCVMAGLQNEIPHLTELERIIQMCSSFLTTRGDHIYFIHQSAKDYLTSNASATVFPKGQREVHYELFSRSLNSLGILKRDIYNLDDLGPVEADTTPNPDPLKSVRYSIVFWLDHFFEADKTLKYSHEIADSGNIDQFFHTHLLHWLESLGLIGEMSSGVLAIQKLLQKVQTLSSPRFTEFLKDAVRFVLSYRSVIEEAPLQAYGASLAFSPKNSAVKNQYWKDRLFSNYIKNIRGIDESWNACWQVLEPHAGPVFAVAFSPDGHVLASASAQTMRLWDAATGSCLQVLERYEPVRAIAFSPGGQMLASASYDGILRLWDVVTGSCSQVLKAHDRFEKAITFSKDGQTLISVSKNGTVQLWDIATGAYEQISEGYNKWDYKAIAISPDTRILASSLEDGIIRLWDMDTGSYRHILEGHNDSILVIAFSQDGQTLASVSKDNRIWLWDVATGSCRKILNAYNSLIPSRLIYAIAFSGDSQILASASGDGIILFWDINTGSCLQTLSGHNDMIYAITFSPDGQTLASASEDDTIRLWNTAVGDNQQNLNGHHSTIMYAINFSPDGQTLVSAFKNGTLQLWDTATGRCRQVLGSHDNPVHLIISPDNQILASALDDCSLQLWDAATGSFRRTLKGHKHSYNLIAFSPDGRTLASASNDCIVRLWDAATGNCQQVLERYDHVIQAIVFSPDSRSLALAPKDGTVRLWDIARGRYSQVLEGRTSRLQNVAFSPDGQILVSTSGHTLWLWDTGTGSCRHVLNGHKYSINVIAFSPDGQTLASASGDQTVRLWDTVTGGCRQVIVIDNCPLRLSFSADGQYLNTDKGDLILNQEKSIYTKFVKKKWIVHGGQNLLWLPPDYRTISTAVYKNMIALGYPPGRVVFLEFFSELNCC